MKKTNAEAILLFSGIRRTLNITYLRRLRPLKLGTKQVVIIRFVAANPKCSLAAVSRATASDPAAVGRAIDSLVRSAWLSRKDHPTDRRRSVLELSATGKKKFQQLDKIYAELSDILVSPLDSGERQQFVGLLRKIHGALEKDKANKK